MPNTAPLALTPDTVHRCTLEDRGDLRRWRPIVDDDSRLVAVHAGLRGTGYDGPARIVGVDELAARRPSRYTADEISEVSRRIFGDHR